MPALPSTCASRRGLFNGGCSTSGSCGGRAAPRAAAPRRAGIVARAEPLEGPLFKLPQSSLPDMTIEDIRDAYEVCSTIPAPGERAQCYSTWGLDSDRMAAYYETVMGLETALESAPRFGPFGGGGVSRAHARGDSDDFRSASASMAE